MRIDGWVMNHKNRDRRAIKLRESQNEYFPKKNGNSKIVSEDQH